MLCQTKGVAVAVNESEIGFQLVIGDEKVRCHGAVRTLMAVVTRKRRTRDRSKRRYHDDGTARVNKIPTQ